MDIYSFAVVLMSIIYFAGTTIYSIRVLIKRNNIVFTEFIDEKEIRRRLVLLGFNSSKIK